MVRVRVAAYTRSSKHPAVRRVRHVFHEVAAPEAGVERTLKASAASSERFEPDALILSDTSVPAL